MMLAFLIDQVQQRCCAVFRRARARAKRPKYLWENLRSAFLMVAVPDWETLYALATKDGVVAVQNGRASRTTRPAAAMTASVLSLPTMAIISFIFIFQHYESI